MNRRRQPAVFAFVGMTRQAVRVRLVYIRDYPPSRYRSLSDPCGLCFVGMPDRRRQGNKIAFLQTGALQPSVLTGRFLRFTENFYNLIFS